jgi:hypothetical protein
MTPSRSPATVVVSRVVHAKHAGAFRDWSQRVDAAARDQPGYRSSVRLEQPGGLFHLVLQFADRAQLDAWQASALHARLLAEGERFSIRRQQIDEGAQSWFQIPGESSAARPKQFVLTWLTVLPILLGLNGLIALLPFELPLPVRLGVSSLVMTALLTWVILPRVYRRVRPWLLSNGEGEIREP